MPKGRRESGFTIIEAMVAVLVMGIMLTAAFALFIDDWKAYRSQTLISEMRQNGRSAMELMTRDLLQAGYGLRDAMVEVPVMVANTPTDLLTFSSGAITMLTNQRDVATQLNVDMSDGNSNLRVPVTTGFAVGQRGLIYDDLGSWDWFTITSVSSDQLGHNTTTLSKAYIATDNANVALVDEIVYKHDSVSRRVLRMENRGPWLTVADEVTSLTFRYYDETGVELFPADDVARRNIRRISMTLVVTTQAADPTKYPLQKRTQTLRSDVTPRNLSAYPSI